MDKILKPLYWLGDSLDRLRTFPKKVQRQVGGALQEAQLGGKHPDAKPLRGFGGAGVLEVVESHDGSTFRAAYTIRYTDVVYVLHVFQKRSHKGIATPLPDIQLIKQRLKQAEEVHRASGK
jgi:phage-related protein